jgi:hypothetical protein
MPSYDRGSGSQFCTWAAGAGTFSPKTGLGGSTASTLDGAGDTELLLSHTYGRTVILYGVVITTTGTGSITFSAAYSNPADSKVVAADTAPLWTVSQSVATAGTFMFGGPEGILFPNTDGASPLPHKLALRYTIPATCVGSFIYKVL